MVYYLNEIGKRGGSLNFLIGVYERFWKNWKSFEKEIIWFEELLIMEELVIVGEIFFNFSFIFFFGFFFDDMFFLEDWSCWCFV